MLKDETKKNMSLKKIKKEKQRKPRWTSKTLIDLQNSQRVKS